MLEIVTISSIEYINDEDSNNTCINKIIMKTMIILIMIKTMIMLIKSPDNEDAKDREPKSDASPQGLKMGTRAST